MNDLAVRNPFSLLASERRARFSAGLPVVLSLNPIEYHGPHLTVRNDGLVARCIAEQFHRGLRAAHPEWDELLWAEFDVGADPVPHPESVHVPYRDFRRLVLGLCRDLAGMGVRRVILHAFHGSPRHSLAFLEGVDLLRAAGVQAFSPMPLLLAGMIELPRTCGLAARDRGDSTSGARWACCRTFHAGFIETSVSLHYVPGRFRRG